ncbi:MAG: hypothetical protein IKD77_00585 [Bacilli bacterium]|nr:hypothetical protein [Bacilli bacterium]
MSVYSFLSKEQIEMSELIGTRGKKTEITDFSIFLGGSAGNTRERDKKYGKYWTKTDYDSSNNLFC